MNRGSSGRLKRFVVAITLTLLGVLALSVPALGAGDPPPVPKPDPPPKAAPPPPPQVSNPPPAPQPVTPVAPVAPAPVTAPAVIHPTAAERRAAAALRAAAARRAKRKAARAARAKRIAAEKIAAAHRRERAQAAQLTAGSDTASSSWGLPFLLVAFGAALLMLGLAVTPARAVPWSRASRVLEDRRDEFGVLGAMGLVATFVFFLLVQVTK